MSAQKLIDPIHATSGRDERGESLAAHGRTVATVRLVRPAKPEAATPARAVAGRMFLRRRLPETGGS